MLVSEVFQTSQNCSLIQCSQPKDSPEVRSRKQINFLSGMMNFNLKKNYYKEVVTVGQTYEKKLVTFVKLNESEC